MKKKSGKKPDLTEVVVVMDESGSMASVLNDVIGGFNTFIEDQKKEKGACNLTLVKFSTNVANVYESKDIQDVEPLDRANYTPGGSTALFDAIVSSIKGLKVRKTKATKVLFLIMTDGEENCSKEVTTKAAVKKIVDDCISKDKFEFMYIGANQDAFSEGNSLGIGKSLNYISDSKGTQSAYRCISNVVTCYRSTGKVTI